MTEPERTRKCPNCAGTQRFVPRKSGGDVWRCDDCSFGSLDKQPDRPAPPARTPDPRVPTAPPERERDPSVPPGKV